MKEESTQGIRPDGTRYHNVRDPRGRFTSPEVDAAFDAKRKEIAEKMLETESEQTEIEANIEQLQIKGVEHFCVERPPVPEFDRINTPSYARKTVKRIETPGIAGNSELTHRMLENVVEEPVEYYENDENEEGKAFMWGPNGEMLSEADRVMQLESNFNMNIARKKKPQDVDINRIPSFRDELEKLVLKSIQDRTALPKRTFWQKLRDKWRIERGITRTFFRMLFYRVKIKLGLIRKVDNKPRKLVKSAPKPPTTFKPDIRGIKIEDLSEEKFIELRMRGNVILRNSRTGTTIVAPYDLSTLKEKYEGFEVVPPTIR